VSARAAERAARRSDDALGEVLARCVRARVGTGGVVARCLDLETQRVRPIELGTQAKKPMSSREVRSLAEQAWERLMQYHEIWGCFPWERKARPRSSTEFEPTVDPKRTARELGEYLQARATLRREAEERVRATSFFSAFTQAASDIGMGWLETFLTAPGEVIETIGGQTRDEFLADEHWQGPSVEEFEELTIGGLMDLVLKAELLTGSCGSTAGLIHEIVDPASANTTPAATDAGGVIEALTRADERSTSSGETQYVRIEGGGHAFVVEVGGGTCRLLQSFFGTSTLARDLGMGKVYSLRSLVALLRIALLPNAEPTSEAQTKIVRARRELFASQAVHPDARGFKVHEFGCQPGMQERLAKRRTTGERLWEPVLLEPASSITFVEPPTEVTHARLTGEHVIPHSGTDHLFYFGEGYTAISTRDLEEGKRYAMRFAAQVVEVKVTSNANGHVVVTVLAADDTEDEGSEK
jgi:hypothetical protein